MVHLPLDSHCQRYIINPRRIPHRYHHSRRFRILSLRMRPRSSEGRDDMWPIQHKTDRQGNRRMFHHTHRPRKRVLGTMVYTPLAHIYRESIVPWYCTRRSYLHTHRYHILCLSSSVCSEAVCLLQS